MTNALESHNAPILIVDDDMIIRSLTRAALEQEGFTIEEAADGEEACRICDRMTPRLIVVDVVMPGMNGFELCQVLRRRPQTAHVPILMATGLDDVDSITQAYDAGATDFITKPLNWTILNHRIRYLLRASLAFDEAQRAKQEVEVSAAAVRTANELLERRVEERTQELRMTQEKLLKEERFSTVGHVTATVAHELRNPLGAISNTIFVVRTATANNPALARAADRMDRSVARCNKIIRNLLEYTMVRDFKRERVTLDLWLGSILDDERMPAGIEMRRCLAAPHVVLEADTDRMRRVVVNLIENAVQAVEDRADGEKRCITVTTRFTDSVEIVVEDTGSGIAADVLPRIFEPLFSTRGFGTGLGLATAKQIVDQHDGSIEVATEPGRDTSFRVVLPCASAKTVAA
jgi:signal transduction histidine kinase